MKLLVICSLLKKISVRLYNINLLSKKLPMSILIMSKYENIWFFLNEPMFCIPKAMLWETRVIDTFSNGAYSENKSNALQTFVYGWHLFSHENGSFLLQLVLEFNRSVVEQFSGRWTSFVLQYGSLQTHIYWLLSSKKIYTQHSQRWLRPWRK